MDETRKALIYETLKRLNWNYGRGDIIHVEYKPGGGIVTCQKQYGQESRPYFLDGDTVFFRGHQRNINKAQKDI